MTKTNQTTTQGRAVETNETDTFVSFAFGDVVTEKKGRAIDPRLLQDERLTVCSPDTGDGMIGINGRAWFNAADFSLLYRATEESYAWAQELNTDEEEDEDEE